MTDRGNRQVKANKTYNAYTTIQYNTVYKTPKAEKNNKNQQQQKTITLTNMEKMIISFAFSHFFFFYYYIQRSIA